MVSWVVVLARAARRREKVFPFFFFFFHIFLRLYTTWQSEHIYVYSALLGLFFPRFAMCVDLARFFSIPAALSASPTAGEQTFFGRQSTSIGRPSCHISASTSRRESAPADIWVFRATHFEIVEFFKFDFRKILKCALLFCFLNFTAGRAESDAPRTYFFVCCLKIERQIRISCILPSKSFSRCLWESVTTGHLKSCDLRLFGSIATPRIGNWNSTNVHQREKKRKEKRYSASWYCGDPLPTHFSWHQLTLLNATGLQYWLWFRLLCVGLLGDNYEFHIWIVCSFSFVRWHSNWVIERSRESLEKKKKKIGDDAYVFIRQDEWRRDGGVRWGRRDSRSCL